MPQQMDAGLAPYVPYPLFQETCRSWSRIPEHRENWPNVPRLRTNLQHEDGLVPHTLRQAPSLERPPSQLPAEKVMEMTEVKNHRRPWMIPGVGLSPACLRSASAQLQSQVIPLPGRASTSPTVTAYRPSSSVYTRIEPNSPLYRQQAFWQTVFSSPRAGDLAQNNTTMTQQTRTELPNCESPTIGKQLQHQDLNNLPDEVESSGGGSATTYFSDTSGIAYFLPSALSFTSSTRSSMIKNSNDLFINTNAQSRDLGEWPSVRAVEESEISHTSTKSWQATTPSPAVLDSAHSYGWWDVLRTPFLVNTPASRAGPASTSGLTSSMAQAQAQALKEVLLNVPSLASMTGDTVTEDTSNVATFRLQKLDMNSSEDTRNQPFAPARPAPPAADVRSPPPRTTSLFADAYFSYHQAPQALAQYASRSDYIMPTAAPLQPTQRIHTEPQTQWNIHMPLPLPQHRRPPIPTPVTTAPTELHLHHSFANPLNPSIASPLFFRTVLNPANDINNHNNNDPTTTRPRPDRPPPLPPIPVTDTVSAPSPDAGRADPRPDPGSKQKGMFSNSLERMKRDRARPRNRDLDGLDFCCRGIPDQVVTLEFEPPPREGGRGHHTGRHEAGKESAKLRVGRKERPGEVARMPTVKDLRETRGGHGYVARAAEGWQGSDRETGHQKGESLGKSVGRWMVGLMR